jgi:O-antigen/teichoic acid export membrane protein
MFTGIDVAFAIAFTPARSALQGLQRYDLCNLVSTSGVLVGAAAIVAVLAAGWGVLGMIASSIPVTIGMGLASRWWARRVAPRLAFGWRGANRATLWRMTTFSASMFAMQCGGRLQTKSDEFVIAFFRPVDAVTPYVLSRKLGEVAQLGAVQFLNVLMPLASELDARGDRGQLRMLYVTASRVTLGITAPAAVALIVLGGPLLGWWVGAGYAPYGDLVAVLAASSFIGVSQWPAAAVLQGMSRHHILAVTSLGAGAANIILSVLLLPVFGLLGVGLGTLLPTVVGSLCVILPVTARIVGVPMRTVLRDVWIAGLLPAIAAAVVLWLPWTALGSAPGAASLLSRIALIGMVYAAVYLSMPAASIERQFLSDIAGSGWRRLRPAAASVFGIDQQQQP